MGTVDPDWFVGYERYLRKRGYAARTIEAYLWVADFFVDRYAEVNEDSLLEYRDWLIASFKPATANQRIGSINCYLEFLGLNDLKLVGTCIRQKSFRECAIDFAAYQRLLQHLRDGGYDRDYHAVRMLATTGARISELLRMEVSHVRDGYVDVVNKGRERRIHIPDVVATEALEWAEGEGRSDGPLFLNRYGKPITARGISYQLKVRATECNIDEQLVYPQAVRHLLSGGRRRYRLPRRPARPCEHSDHGGLLATYSAEPARRGQPHCVLVETGFGVCRALAGTRWLIAWQGICRGNRRAL